MQGTESPKIRLPDQLVEPFPIRHCYFPGALYVLKKRDGGSGEWVFVVRNSALEPARVCAVSGAPSTGPSPCVPLWVVRAVE